MALFDGAHLIEELGLSSEIAERINTDLNRRIAKTEVREKVLASKYDDVEANKQRGDDEYDRIAYAEALHAFATFLGNQGGFRLSEKGGLMNDLSVHNAETIRQLLSQREMEEVQGRLRQQADRVLGDLVDPSGVTWAI